MAASTTTTTPQQDAMARRLQTQNQLYTNANKQFDVARDRAAKQEAANLGAQKEALARRAAQLGGGPSGALIKQENLATDASANRLQQANEGIDAAQSQEQGRIAEVLQGQEFASTEAEKQRQFAKSERLGGEKFQAGQSKQAIDAAYKQFKEDLDFKRARGEISDKQWKDQFDQLTKQQEFENSRNDAADYITSIINAHNAGISVPQMSAILEQLGYTVANVPGLTGYMNGGNSANASQPSDFDNKMQEIYSRGAPKPGDDGYREKTVAKVGPDGIGYPKKVVYWADDPTQGGTLRVKQ